MKPTIVELGSSKRKGCQEASRQKLSESNRSQPLRKTNRGRKLRPPLDGGPQAKVKLLQRPGIMAAAARTPETLSTNINQEEGRLRSGGSTPTRPTTATCCKDASKRRSDATETAAANICTRRKTVPGSLRHALFFGNIPLKAGCPCSIMQEDHARIQSQQAATWAPIRVLPKTHQLLGILFLNHCRKPVLSHGPIQSNSCQGSYVERNGS